MAVRLFVGNLPYNVTEAELKDLFSTVGSLSYVYLPTDRETGKLRGFAFVDFDDRAAADEAVRRFNNQLFKGRPLSVNEARAREDRPRPSAPSQAYAPRPGGAASPSAATPDASGGGAAKNFGPDAAPRRNKGKGKGSPRTERVPKGPMREVVKGQFFGGGDDGYDDDDDLTDDLGEDNFASRIPADDDKDDE